jgi:hypothetical protein
MRNLATRTSQDWVQYFRRNGFVTMRVPWHLGADLPPDERAAIAHSIRVFQLGESSEGRHLMRYAREWAGRSGDAAYTEAIRMLIAEEQRHASALARFMEMNGIERMTHGFSDRIFRRLRNVIGSLEISIGVLVTAEIIAKVYYPALCAATNSVVLQAICDQIQRDEIAHVEFQTEQLARIRATRTLPAIWATAAVHRILFYPTAVLVALSHHAVIRRGGMRMRTFLSRCRREFLLDLAAMDPRNRNAWQVLEHTDQPLRKRAIHGRTISQGFDGARGGT